MPLKKSEIICKYEVFPFGCSSSELFMRRGIMTMQPLWIKRLHSLHFRGRIHYPSMEKVYQRMEWTERRWDDQMYRRRTFSDSSQRGRRLQPSEYEWDSDRAPSKVCPTTVVTVEQLSEEKLQQNHPLADMSLCGERPPPGLHLHV